MCRTGEAARLFAEHGSVLFVALVSPLVAARADVRRRLAKGRFLEVYCHCPRAAVERRVGDPHGA